uniref:SDR family NAD(P)-dependent oxidoreductase n=1 Tax=Herbidospora sakaeratensis TaxID=564415 RepID=UPI0007849907|nr:SDR family NAD(P)-dependent oxidoreductase [Herbidospora sakaeratensis]
MKNAFGEPQSLLLVGGASDIAMATAMRLVRRRVRRVILAGRPSPARDAAAARLAEAGATVETADFDAFRVEEHAKVIGDVFAEGDVDVALVACGLLGDADLDPLKAADVAMVNYVGAMTAAIVCADAMRRQTHGALVVFSSVSAGRPSGSDFLYASAKSGLDAFARGLTEALRGSGVHVMVVRPGFVRSRLTRGVTPPAIATSPETVAGAVLDGLRAKSEIVWVPGILGQLTRLPGSVVRRITG